MNLRTRRQSRIFFGLAPAPAKCCGSTGSGSATLVMVEVVLLLIIFVILKFIEKVCKFSVITLVKISYQLGEYHEHTHLRCTIFEHQCIIQLVTMVFSRKSESTAVSIWERCHIWCRIDHR
jgi:hypothetical protein